MNVALPASIIFLVLLPGFTVRARFKRVENSSLDYSPFGQVVLTAILWAGLGHLVWLIGSYEIFGRTLDISVFLKLLSSDHNQASAIEAVTSTSRWVVIYFVSLLGAAYFLPAFIRFLIIRYRLDRSNGKFSAMFRFHQAPWYYLLTGADFEKGHEPDFISVSAIVNIADEAFIYTGMLDEFFLDKNGVLDRLILQQVIRRPLASNISASLDNDDDVSQFYEIPGDYFVLRYNEAITLNVEYVALSPVEGDVENIGSNVLSSGSLI